MLAALASQLAVGTVSASEEIVAVVRQLVDEARDLLAEDDTLPMDLRRHLRSVLSHAFRVAKHFHIFGEFSLKMAMERLIVGLHAASHTST